MGSHLLLLDHKEIKKNKKPSFTASKRGSTNKTLINSMLYLQNWRIFRSFLYDSDSKHEYSLSTTVVPPSEG